MPTGSWQRLSGPCPIGGLAGCPKLFALIRRLEKEETGDDSEERIHCLCHRVQRDTCDGTNSDVFCEILAQDNTTPHEKYSEVWHHVRPGFLAVNVIGVARLLARYSNLRFSAKWFAIHTGSFSCPDFLWNCVHWYTDHYVPHFLYLCVYFRACHEGTTTASSNQ